MKTLNVTWKGVTPLFMNSCRAVNTLHPLTKEMNKYTGKRTKTDDDYEAMSDIEWLSGLYYTEDADNALTPADDAYIFVPADNIEAVIKVAAAHFRKGSAVKSFVRVVEQHARLEFYDNRPVAEIWKDFKYRDVRPANVKRSKVIRTRPRFDRWEISFTLRYDDEHIDLETLINAIEYAGAYVGIGDYRPRYGQFVSIIEEV